MKPGAFSTHSSPQNLKAPVWDCPSAGGSSSRMAAACGRAPTQDGVPCFNSRCPARDGRLAASSSTRWRQEAMAYNATHRIGFIENRCPSCIADRRAAKTPDINGHTGSGLLGDKAAVDDELGTG